MVLGVVLAAELAVAAVLLGPTPAVPRSGDTMATPPTPSPASPPSSLVLADRRTVHLLGLGGATTSALLARIAAQINGAVDAVVAFWGPHWQRDIVIVAAGSDAQFVQLTRGPTGGNWVDVAAAAVADDVDPAHRTATGQRVVFAPGASAMSEYALRITLRHELFHFASRADTALEAPRWLTEGVADFVGRPAQARPGPVMAATFATLPTDADFTSSGSALSLAYDRAWWFARFVADTHGTAMLRDLYLRAGGNGHLDTADALRAVLGVDERELITRWRRWLTG
jgi:hypothetical protein